MEVRRRSYSSGYEFRERSGRKKKGAVPLAMMLTFNDKDVHPDCPNVSNPYHKCGRHCLREIPHGKMFLDAIRSDEDPVCDNKSERKKLNPNCNHASNHYHKCAEYCLEKMSEKRQDAGKDQPGMNPNEEKKEIFTTERGVKPACLYASNPYHVCAEYCFQTAPEKDQPRQSMRLKGPKEREKVLSAKEKSGFHTQCKLASNPSHECTESCFQSVTERNLVEGEKPKGVFNKTNKNSVHLNRNASSINKINEHCFEYTPKKEHPKGGMRPKKQNEIDVTTQRAFTFECKNASNPYHVCVEYCFQSVPEREHHGQVVRRKSSKEGENVMSNAECTAAKPKEESEIIVTVDQRVNLEYKNLSNPSHICLEYCSENVPERDRHEEVIRLKSTKEGGKFMNNRQTTGFDPQCKQVSKPHNECTELCFKNTPDGNLAEGENSEGMSMETDKYVHSSRKHGSSHNDEVIEYCCEDTSEKEHPEGAIKKFKEEEIVVLPSERRVSPDCKFSSNPYHVCAEYCLQNGLEREQHGQVMKLKSFKELKKLVSKKKITSGQPQCEFASNPYHKCAEYCFNKNIQVGKVPDGVVKTNERRKEKSYAPRRDDNPKYKNALNSFGRCAEYSPEEISPTSEVVEGSTAAVKERKRNSFKENIRNHPIVEKISLNSNYMEASKPSHNYIDSSEGIILQDGTEKSSMDSMYVEAFNPTNSNFNLNNGISMCMQDGTKDLQSAKVMDIKNPKEATDMAPLHIDVSDLFHEWSKYCSQTELAEDEIVIKQEKKAGMGELISRRNGKNDSLLNDYDSTNMEKVQATGGFPRSLPISLLVLFLLGFLLALFHWAQVIYSLVMSSEKNEKPHERMKLEKHSVPECKMVYDPYHICSEYCFSGVGEEIHYTLDSSEQI